MPRKNSFDRPPRRQQRSENDEQRYYGMHACRAIFDVRPADVVRVHLAADRVTDFSADLKKCAERRVAYHIVEDDNLERLSETVHHQGIVVTARKLPRWDDEQFLKELTTGPRSTGGSINIPGPVIYLDGVENPHNLGSILRTAVHFGVRVVCGPDQKLPPISSSAARVAAGAAEYVPTAGLQNPLQTLKQLQTAGFHLCTTTSHEKTSPADSPSGLIVTDRHGAPTAIPATDRCVLVMGNEVSGVSPAVERLADVLLSIPGSGLIESLNVGVATGILLFALRRHRLSKRA